MSGSDFQNSIEGLPPASGFGRDLAVIVVIGLAVLFLLVFWARYLRGSRRKRSRTQGMANGSGPEAGRRNGRSTGERRREHRPRNPTLAEQGGLPPIRSEGAARKTQ